MKNLSRLSFIITLLMIAGILTPRAVHSAPSLDGLRDADYGSALATDPAGDLATPGPADWIGTHWTDQTAIYCTADTTYLYVYADLTDYQLSVSDGQIGLILNTQAGGGTTDPWANAITFGHADPPDYIIRGNVAGVGGSNGWTELRTWLGGSWSAGGTNWGGIPAGSRLGTQVAYADNNGMEIMIPRSSVGLVSATTVELQFFATQGGGGKGAYDTVPTDDQSTGWDDPTTLGNYITCNLGSTGSVSLMDSRALWVEENIIAWNSGGGATYELHYDIDGDLAIPMTAGSGISLSWAGTLNSSSYPKSPNVNGYDAWQIGAGDLAQIPTALKSEVAIAKYDGAGDLVDATRIQLQGVIDDLYSYNGDLGVTYSGTTPSVRVWAPTALNVTLHRYADANPVTTSVTNTMSYSTTTGVWSVMGDPSWTGQFYQFEVEVFVPETDAIEHNLVSDPYAVNLSQNSLRSQFVDLYNDATLKPPGWDSLVKPTYTVPEDIVVYEVHVRDFSIHDTSVITPHRGTFKAFTYDGSGMPLSDGMNHLINLEAAGLTHIHLLPAFDIATVDEDPTTRSEPDWATLSGYAADSNMQQATISTTRRLDGFNWGYDPYHYGVPEGSYATVQDDATRVLEFREMVQALNENGLRVVMDVVYNHTSSNGQLYDNSVLDKIVPNYYHRYDNSGNQQNSSCCADTAAEFDMMEKLMIDTLRRWAIAYKVDGFRFDLMNLHTVANMQTVQTELQSLTLGTDGVDGSEIYVYGEGWNFGSAQGKGLTPATQFNMAGTGIGTFNDRIRDALHGGYSTDTMDIRRQGFINGLFYNPNGYGYSNQTQGDLRYQQDRLRVGLAGNLQNFTFMDQTDSTQTGIGLGGTGYTLDPQEAINYISKHDNETLFDQNVFKLPAGTSMADRVRTQNMGLSVIGLSQGIPFFHMGSDMLRSKSLDRNSYDSGDWFNYVDFTYNDNNFGKGLPPYWDNQSRWGIMAPHLTDGSLYPAQSDILDAVAHLQEILAIRQSSKLFRLETAADINARLEFHNTGSSQQDGLIVMSLRDNVGADLDPLYDYIVVLFNANDVAQTFTIGDLAGLSMSLHPIQQTSNDPIVQTASYTTASGQFNIPARTTAVFVGTTAPAAPAPSSTIDWVGNMFPVGGESFEYKEGVAGTHDVYLQVYDAGITEAAGQGAGTSCYLYWGAYGGTWTDSLMTYWGDVGNNDEYLFSMDTSGLSAGIYGYTGYCTNDGGATKQWRSGADGILSITPAIDPNPTPNFGAFVQLFEWKWSDVAFECENWLAPQGYSAVQVSPPQEHRIVADTGSPNFETYPWWQRYQPVSYVLGSRSGDVSAFNDMVSRCNAAGIDVYVDVIINHMAAGAAGTGSAGSSYDPPSVNYPTVPYDITNFHPACDILSYAERQQVQECTLLGLPDLDHQNADTLTKVQTFLNNLVSAGVAGFRIDAAKHIFAYDIDMVFAGVTGDPYIFQEVIEAPGEPIKGFEYFNTGDVTEFDFSNGLGIAFSGNGSCTGTLSDLQTFATGVAFMDSQFAVVFVDNHDNQRGHGTANPCIVTHQDGEDLYNLANVFMLAQPYGYPKVMSSYYFANDDQGPPADGSGNTNDIYSAGIPTGCNGTDWVCEHRRTSIANMNFFREAVMGEPVTDWWDNGTDQIAFGRNDKGFVVLNREAVGVTRTFQTSMLAGNYCNIWDGSLNGDGSACTGSTITVDSSGQFTATVNSMQAVVIHIHQQPQTNAELTGGVSISYSGMDVQLNWTDSPNNCSYEIYRSATPYFDITGMTPYDTLGAGNSSYDALGNAGNSASNYYYTLRAINCNVRHYVDSQRLAEFDFTITPGS